MKITYIAHPVSGDVVGNIEKILDIVRKINMEEPETVPFVPYLADLYALDDSIPAERERGIKNGVEIIRRGIPDEIRLYGNRISNGMEAERKAGIAAGIPIVDNTGA